MDQSQAPSFNTKLNDRVLWFDGDSTISNSKLTRFIQLGRMDGVFVDKTTKEIEQYNNLVPPQEHITVKESCEPLDFSWNLPEEYIKIDIENYLVDRLGQTCLDEHLSDEEIGERVQRLKKELQLFDQLQLFDVLKVLIFVINTLTKQNVVWGVGRGSSVSSYILYLIGVHDIDSVKYDLDISDFLRL